MKNKFLVLLRLIVGLTILGTILFKIGLPKVLRNMTEVNLWFVPLFILIISAIIYVASINIKALSLPFNNQISAFKIFKYYSLSWVLSLVTPGRLGELSIIYFLKKEKLSIGQSSAIVVLDKLVSLTFISILAIIGFFRFFTKRQGTNMAMIISAIFLIFSFLFFTKIGRSLIKKFILRSYSIKFKGFSIYVADYFKRFKKLLLLNFILTIVKFSLSALLTYCFFLSLNQFALNYFNVLLINCIIAIISIIPISFNGLGLNEGAAIYLYGGLGIEKTVVGSTVIYMLIFNYIIATIVWFAFSNKNMIATLKDGKNPSSP